MKWARGRCRYRGEAAAARGRGCRPAFELVIEDDGPGIPEDKAREALKRGRRLDETKPGTGLGLAIVADLVNEYGGKLVAGTLGARRAEGDGATLPTVSMRLVVAACGPNFGQIWSLAGSCPMRAATARIR